MDPNVKINFLAIGVGIVIVIVTLFIFQFAGKLEKEDEAENSTKNSNNQDEDHFDYSNVLSNNDSADGVMGKTEKYEWLQTADDIEVYIPLAKFGESINIRDVDIKITTKTLKVTIRKEILITGEFSAAVNEDDSLWTLDNNSKTDPHLYLTLYKITPTAKNQHWKSLLKGDPEINVSRFGPPVHALDNSDEDGIKKAIRQVKQSQREK